MKFIYEQNFCDGCFGDFKSIFDFQCPGRYIEERLNTVYNRKLMTY